MRRLTLCVLLVCMLLGACGRNSTLKQERTPIAATGNVAILDAWVRPAVLDDSPNVAQAQGPTGAGYLSIRNSGLATERLLEIVSESVTAVEIHSSEQVNGVMHMRPVEGGLAIAAGATLDMQSAGLHVMLIGIKRELRAGDTLILILRFEQSGDLRITAQVRNT